MPPQAKSDTHQKALALNLDPTIFGSFAEIGAGQEVARWFLRVGAASGTVAKTISAYDKVVSDHLYGIGWRYVSKPRLQAMLNSEWDQLLAQLHDTRGADTRFFSFVDTISARNYAGTNDCHGWIGLRFLREPNEAPNDVILHVNLRDSTNVAQQEAIGILGVNLIDAAIHARASVEEFLASVCDDLELQRIEIDVLEVNGLAFAGWDRDEIQSLLVARGYAEAVVFSVDGQILPANELLYKRMLVLVPGRFDRGGLVKADLVRNTLAQLPEEELKESKGGLGLFCLSVASLNSDRNAPSIQKIVDQVRTLRMLGHGVMLFRAKELYKMSGYVNRYTNSRIYFAIGLSLLVRVFEDRYEDLAGALLEGVARLFTQNVRISVYPMPAEELRRCIEATHLKNWKWTETNGMVSADNVRPPGAMASLYAYLFSSKFILPGRPSNR